MFKAITLSPFYHRGYIGMTEKNMETTRVRWGGGRGHIAVGLSGNRQRGIDVSGSELMCVRMPTRSACWS